MSGRQARRPVILASASRARREMLERAGVTAEIVPAAIDEIALRDALRRGEPDATPIVIARTLADAKALEVSARFPEALVIGADQMLEHVGETIDKSVGLEAAAAVLLRLAGSEHCLHAAVAIAVGGQILWSHVDTARLVMRPLDQRQVERYLATAGDRVLGSVGCYEIEGLGAQLFERIDGDHFTILGMPLLALLGELRRQGAII